MPDNLYVHFPFCRTKCSYCALYSRAGVSQSDRDAYVRRLAAEIGAKCPTSCASLKTVYFGGGSPALCDLSVLAPVLRPLCGEGLEFTVELHPLDVTERKLQELKDLGVNRISMGVQSLDDATLADMGRGYTIDEAARAFARVKRFFDNAGIDLIVGYPGDEVKVVGVGVGVGSASAAGHMAMSSMAAVKSAIILRFIFVYLPVYCLFYFQPVRTAPQARRLWRAWAAG